MEKPKIVLATAVVGVGVGITYHLFEGLVHGAINLIWYQWLDSDATRWLVVPACLIITLIFFGLQHRLDPKSETKTEEGLGSAPKASIKNYGTVLLIGFFSLLAGASLGPEAILVPACMILGAYVGEKILDDSKLTKVMAAAGIMALFTAFFHSVIVGLLSILLVTRQAKTKITPGLALVAVVATLSCFYTLQLIEAKAYVSLPAYSWNLNLETVAISLLLVLAGFISTGAMASLGEQIQKIRSSLHRRSWLLVALVAAAGLSALYLAGGPLVEFTGNKSIQPLLEQAPELGLVGLAWIIIIKIFAISWSKFMGYRGGMIFPTIFLASAFSAIALLYVPSFNLIYGIIAVIAGALIANRRNHVLV